VAKKKKTDQTDAVLTGRIRDYFTRDQRLSSQPIDAAVKDGIVTLTGTVQTHRRKLAAYEIAASFEGCRDVRNELIVEPAAGIPDDQVADNVRSALDTHADITKATIGVTVSGGKATLTGNVSSRWEYAVAEDVARSALGVRDVNNLLVVDLVEQIEDAGLSQEIVETMAVTSGLKDADINIAVSSGAVVLSGEAPRLWHKATAEAVVRRFWCRRIQNDIVVTGP